MHRVRSVVLKTVLLTVLATVAGCSDLFSPNGNQSRLDENRDKWRAQGLTTYSFTLHQVCFCGINGPVRVVVVNGSAVNATMISNGQSVDPRFVSSIESLFDFIQRGIANHSAVLEVTYDPARGFPTRIVSDGSKSAVDDEVTYEVSDVQPIALTAGALMEWRPLLPLAADQLLQSPGPSRL
jgi:hypothetical protein